MTNRVERLLKKIQEIQKKCEHKFEIIEKVCLKKSKINNVYVGSGKVCYPYTSHESAAEITLQCVRCNLTKETHISIICPKCLNKMQKDKRSRDRTEYFSDKYLYFAAYLYHCEKCNFTIVLDEWNQ